MTARRPSPAARRIAVVVAAALSAAATAACGGGSGSTGRAATPASSTSSPSTTLAATRGNPEPLGPCRPAPAAGAAPTWLPADLTLPPGSYPVAPGPAETGVQTYVFVVPVAPDDFSAFTLSTWPGAGWKLHRPESEGFEGENRFTRGTAYGGFKVRAVYCDKPKSELTLAYSAGA